MLKALIKKELLELYIRMSTSKKSGRRMPYAGFIALYGGIFVVGGILIYMLAAFFQSVLLPLQMDWMYFAMMSLFTLVIALVGNVFTAYALLYKSKDMEPLLAMPISPSKLLLARMLVLYILGMFYASIIWIPTIVCYYLHAQVTFATIICPILMLLVFGLFVLTLSCLLGWVVALIASRIRSKAIGTALTGIALVGVYYLVYFRLQESLKSFANYVQDVEAAMQGWGYPVYVVGMACVGKIIPLISVILTVGILFALCYFIMSKTFIKITTRNVGAKKNENKKVKVKGSSSRFTLVRRELIHFKGSAVYMMNCGLTLVIMLVLGVVLIIKSGDLMQLFEQVIPLMSNAAPMIYGVVVAGMIGVLCMVISIGGFTAPSISLEGSSLWIIRTLPVSGKEVLRGKIDMHILLETIPTLFLSITACVVIKLELFISILFVIFALLFIILIAEVGIVLGVLRPNFDWTSETVPVKQSMPVAVTLFGGWIFGIIVAGFYILSILKFDIIIPIWAYLLGIDVAIGIAVIVMLHWINTKGAERFEKL